MAHARLHLICGNCGCNDMWTYNHIPQEIGESEVMVTEDVFIYCGNCITLHSLNDNATKEEQ